MSESPSQVSAAPTTGQQAPTADLTEPAMHETVPVRRRIRLRDIWRSLPVAWMLGLRDMKVKYKQSALGPLWLVIQPLGMLLAFTVAFSAVTSIDTGNVPYVVFALVGLSVWTFVQMTISVAPMTLPSNQPLVRRSPCPRVALVTGTMIGVLPPLAVVLTASLVAAVITQGLPTQALLLPIMVAWLLLFMWGVALLVAGLGGHFRDIAAFAPLVVQAGVFLTPVGYPLNISGQVASVLSFNPVSGLIEAWRWSLLDMTPDLFAVGIAGAWTVILVFSGWYVFGRMETRFADYV